MPGYHASMPVRTSWKLLILSTAVLTACRMAGGGSAISVMPNSSGIQLEGVKEHGPENLMGGGTVDGKPVKPDVPAGLTAKVGRSRPALAPESGHPATVEGALQVVSLQPGEPGVPAPSVIQSWRNLLQEGGPSGLAAQDILYSSQQSEIPWANAGRCFHGKYRVKTFPWGKAVIFVTSYIQGKTGSPVNNKMLVLVVQGLTTDGMQAVNGRFGIRHPGLPDGLEWNPADDGKKVRFIP